MTITLNGKPHEVQRAVTIGQLLAELELAVRHVAVEVNQEIVPRNLHAEHRLQEGDQVEVVTLVGGG